jgi:class 3 adenylate cyclase
MASPRAGIHAGEVELEGDDVRGIAVHAAARILGVSQRGEVLVSATVRDLLSGSGLAFADRGEFELRGLDRRRSLAALVQ